MKLELSSTFYIPYFMSYDNVQPYLFQIWMSDVGSMLRDN